MKNKNYDERQLLVRGKAYKWTSLVFVTELAVWCILQEFAGISAAPIGEFLMLLMPPFVTLMIISIIEDAYDPMNSKPGMIIFSLMLIASILMIMVKIRERAVFIAGKRITEDGGLIILYAGWIITAVVYWIKYAKDTKEEKKNRS